MCKKDYNSGVKKGLKLSEDIVRRDTRAIEYLSEKVEKLPIALQGIKDVVEQLNSDIKDIQVEKIFGVVKTLDVKDLEYEERVLLLKILSHISMKYPANENQKRFSSRLRMYLEVNANDVLTNEFDGNGLTDMIDSISVHKIMYQTVKEYLYLRSNTNDYADDFDEILGCFSKDVDKKTTETLIDIKVCLFGIEGLYEQFSAEAEEELDMSYLDISQKKYIDISKECATVYFKGATERKNNLYCESSSYVIFAEKDSIVYVHKGTALKKTMIENVANVSDMFKDKQITAYQDMIFFVIRNDVFYYNLETEKSGLAIRLPEMYNDDGELIPIRNVCLADKKFIYGNGKLYVYDLETGENVVAKDEDGSSLYSGTNYILIGDYIYFLSDYISIKKQFKSGKRVFKYGLKNGFGSAASEPFAMKKVTEYWTNVFYFCATEKYVCVVMEYQFTTSMDRTGFDCVYVDITKDEGEAKPFYMWNSFIYQINSYKNNLVYINASKEYSIISHDFISDKKKTLVKKYGSDEKVSFSDKLWLGKANYQHPKEYIIMGKWLWYLEGVFEQKIVSVC